VHLRRSSLFLMASAALLASVPLAAGADPLAVRSDVRDLGRAVPAMTVSVALSLGYRRTAELEQLIRLQGDRRSPQYRHFLSSRQFDDYFAPSSEAYLATSRLLERAGFRITHTFSNRTLIDASAPAAVAERYFGTEIRRVVQAGAGFRYSNVRSAVIPAELRATVTTVLGLNDLDVAKPLYRFPGAADRAALIARATLADSVNIIANPGFEAGGAAWPQCGNVRASVTTLKAHSGRYSEFAGSVNGAEIKGDAGLCQAVTVPPGGVLSFWVYEGSNEPNPHSAWQRGLLMTANGSVIRSLYATAGNTAGWEHLTYNVAALAGRRLYLYFGVHGDGRAGHYTYQYVDDISLTGAAPPRAASMSAPAPAPAPTPTPYPEPVKAPTPNPSYSPGVGPGTPIGGSLYGPIGYGPLATAQGYDLPVQHGFNGYGRRAAVLVWGDVLNSDLSHYEQQWGISRSGTTYRVSVDGGAQYTPYGGESLEAALDVETIEGIAPGSNIYIFEFPSPTDSDILDAYNAVVSQDAVDVVNSSFAVCESADVPFATATNQIAMQGAAMGITFVAASGDAGAKPCGNDDNAIGVSAPAGDPTFVSVGGTSLRVGTGGVWNAETVWNSNGGAGGGGVSTVFGLPPYQQGIGGVVASGRNQPDISLAADPAYATSVYFNGAWLAGGGTPWASSIFTAYLTEVAQMHGTRVGFVDPSLYNAFARSGYAQYHDIISGNNFGYSARAGYDQASGIGSIATGYGLASALP
jgi:subtilase family serine protease